MERIAPPTFPEEIFNVHRSSAILQITTKRLIQMNPIQESVNKVKCAARGKRSERDGEEYGKSGVSMI